MKINRTQTDNLADKKSSNDSQPKKIQKQLSLTDFHFSAIKTAKPDPQAQLGDGIWKNNLVTICSWNINGLRPTISRGDIQKYIQKANPDILCMNEIKIDQEKFTEFNKEVKLSTMVFPNYNMYWNFCKPPIKGYSGVAVISKVAPIKVQNDLGISCLDGEGRLILLEYEKFYLVAVYVPNSGSGLKRLDYRLKQWDSSFFKYLNDLQIKKPVIVAGDLNVSHQEIDIANPSANLRNPGFTIEERNSFSSLLKGGWVDTFRFLYPKVQKFSYWNVVTRAREKNIGWRLDYFLMNQSNIGWLLDSQINNDVFGSDHCPVQLKLDLGKETKNVATVTTESQEKQIEKQQEQQTNPQ